MPSISPDAPRNDILAILAEIKGAAAQGLPPEEVFPAPAVEAPTDNLIDFTEVVEVPHNPAKGRLTNIAGKVCLLAAGGAIFAAGSQAEEITAIVVKQTGPPVAEANALPVKSSPSPSPTMSPTSLPSPSVSPSPSASPKPSPKPVVIKAPVAKAVKPAVKPSVKPSPKPTTPAFVQSRFGRNEQYTVIEEDFEIIAKDIARISHEFHKPLTIARFNGIKDPRTVKTGDKLAYKDCPTNGVMVNVDDTVSEIAQKYGKTVAQVHELNGGAARAVAGWCIRLAIVKTESYPTNPAR